MRPRDIGHMSIHFRRITMSVPKPRNIYSPRIRVLSPEGHTPAQQQFKEDCDVNTIMNRFHKTGLVDHVSQYQPNYGFASAQTYHESMNVITKAQSMFNDLPSKVRNEFSNDPQAFLEFVQDPKNYEKAKELGIALSVEAEAKAMELINENKNNDEEAKSKKAAEEAKNLEQGEDKS